MADIEKEDKIDQMTADTNRLLIMEDIKKYELAKSRALIQVAQYDAAISECELALADIDRRVAGVSYPEPPKAEEARTPKMGEPVGGKEDK